MTRPGSLILRVCATFIVVMSVCSGGYADTTKPGEYQVKSAMLFNMVKFVDWPPEAFPAEGEAISICVMGKGPFGAALDSLKGEQLKGHTVAVRHINHINEAGICQILVLGELDRRQVASVIERTHQQELLTVSDMPNFAQAGGVVGFTEYDGKIRFVINTTSAQQHRIRISAHLLKIARIVQDSPR